MPLKRIAGPKDIARLNIPRDLGQRLKKWAKANRYTIESVAATAVEEFLARCEERRSGK